MKGRGYALVVLALLGLSSGCTGAYALGYRASYGNDLTPPTSNRAATTSIRYRDYGGALSKMLLLLLTAPQKPTGTTTTTERAVSTSCGATTCTTTYSRETTYTPPTAAEMEAYEQRAKEWSEKVAPAILSGAFRAEAVVDVASTKLGGDTSGWMMGLNFRVPTGKVGPLIGSHLSVGIAGGKYTLWDRSFDRVIDAGGQLDQQTVTEDVSYGYAGMPVKFVGLVTPKLAAYAQADLNFITMLSRVLDEPPGPQVFRVGTQWFGKFYYLSGELSLDRMRLDSLTATAEVGLAF